MTSRLPRRIVTGNDDSGRSGILIQDTVVKRGITAEIWRAGLDFLGSDDQPQDLRLEPPRGGSVFRLFQVGPERRETHLSNAERETSYASHFEAMMAAHCRPDTTRHPGMHRTGTLDYVMLLEGRVILRLDNDEIELEPFDVVVQLGTNHAWINPDDKTALLMAVMIDDRD